MFPLGAWAAIDSASGPAVALVDDAFGFAGVDHRFDSEGHAGNERALVLVAAVHDLRLFVEEEADAVSDKLMHNRATIGFGVGADGIANGREGHARLEDGDGTHQAFVSHFGDEAFFIADWLDHHHAATIAIIAIHDSGHVDVHNVALLEGAVVGNAVADDLVERGADAFRIGRMAVTERGGDGVMLFVEPDSKLVELFGRDALSGVTAELIEDESRDLAGMTNTGDLLGRFKNDARIRLYRPMTMLKFFAAMTPARVVSL